MATMAPPRRSATSGKSPKRSQSSTIPPSVAAGKRARQLRRRIWPLVLAAVLTIILAAVTVWAVWFSNLMTAQRVEATGLRTLTPAQVEQTADVQLGVQLARQDLTAIANRVAALPQVEQVKVTRSWPSTVSIAITERTPEFAVRHANLFVLVDKNGFPYLTVNRQPANLPLADASKDDRSTLTEIAVVARELPSKLSKQVALIRADSPYAIELILDSGLKVSWGEATESKLKGDVTLALLEQNPKAIDVSAPHNPTIR